MSLRLDRFLTLGVVNPLRRAAALLTAPGARAHSLPILMYHSLSADPEPGVPAYYRTTTTPGRFRDHLRFLAAAGWRAVSLREALRQTDAGSAEKWVVLTFDDGFRDFGSEAVPALREHGFGATLFLPTDFISDGERPRQFRGRDCLSWAELRGIRGGDIEWGSHTASHPALTDLTWPRIESELARSRFEIENRLDCAVTSFSYPFAFPQADAAFCARFRSALIAAGYAACVTTEIGCATTADDRYRLRRLPVNEADDLALLRAKLDGDYDWLAAPQRAYKALRHAF